MNKKMTYLVDQTGEIWAQGEFSPTRIKALIKAYGKLNIQLTERGK